MSEVSSVQLEHLETTGTSRPPETYRKFCVTHCQAELEATRSAYESFDNAHHGSHLESLDSCRTGAWFARNRITGKVRVLSSSCKLRWCPMCSSTRRWFLTQEVSSWLKTAKKPKFLTLTLAHTTAPLEQQVIHLYKCFRKYRKLKIMKQNVEGGVWFFQIKKSDSDNLWHPHLHCVIDSEYISKFDLSAAWAAITITSNIIDIRKIDDCDSAAQEVARYASRPSMLADLEEADRLELLESLHGRRLVGTWGTARSISLRPSKPPDADDWINVGTWGLVVTLIRDDYRAAAIWNAFKNDSECAEDCTLHDLENEINDTSDLTFSEPTERYQAWLDFY